MGNYASQAQLKARYEDDIAVAHLTLDEETGVPDTDVLDDVIAGAEGEINSYLAARYAVPVDVAVHTELAAPLTSMTLDLATYRLELRVGQVTDARSKARDDVIDYLEKAQAGTILLPAASPPPATTANTSTSRYGTAGTGTDSKRLFSRETMGKL